MAMRATLTSYGMRELNSFLRFALIFQHFVLSKSMVPRLRQLLGKHNHSRIR